MSLPSYEQYQRLQRLKRVNNIYSVFAKMTASQLYGELPRLLLENEKFFELKSKEYRDGIKRKETR